MEGGGSPEHPTGWSDAGWTPPGTPPPPPAAATAPGVAGGYQGPGSGTAADLANAREPAAGAASGSASLPSWWADTYGEAPRLGGAGAPRRSHRAAWLVAASAVLVVAGIVAGVVAGSGSGSGGDSALLHSAATSLNAKTADLTIGLRMEIEGHLLTASGTGVVDFAHRSSTYTVRYQGQTPLSGVPFTFETVGGTLYESLPTIGQLLPGKRWISVDAGSASSLAPGTSDPSALLELMTQHGAQVTDVGSSTIDGATMEGYRVVFSPSALRRAVRQENAPADLKRAAVAMFGTASIENTVYIDTGKSLVRRIDSTLLLHIDGVAVHGTATEDYSNYGAPVHVATPPPSQVATLRQFEQAAKAAGATTTS